jgi:2-iminobutanoate/2-iminopropanoate deaminase
MKREHIVLPRQLPTGMSRLPFSDAVRVGETLYVAGRLGVDRATGKPPSDPADEARAVMNDVRAVLAAAGMTPDDLVNVTIFAPDVSHFAAFNEVYVTYFSGPLPARAFIGSGPLLFGCRFEVTGIAVAR